MAYRKKAGNIRGLVFAVALMAPTTALVIWSPTLYTLYCNLTGIGGTVQRAPQAAAKPVAGDRTITVYFDANVAPGLSWEFRPEQRKVEARVGEPTTIYYYARNNSSATEVAQATFNIVPFKAGLYFFKIECFCFTRERLAPGESARMPVIFYVDEQILEDGNLSEVNQMTLSYTMFAQNNLTAEEVNAARDLGAGSAALDAKLKNADAVPFVNDAPRK